MMPPPATTSQTPSRPDPAHLLRVAMRQVMRLLLLVSAITLALALLFGGNLRVTWVYTLFITLGCWGSIRVGLILARRVAGEGQPGWPPLPWTVGVVLLGSALGYTAGNALGNWVVGLDNPSLLTSLSRQTLVPVLLALIPGTAFVWYFQTRERLAAAEAQAQTAQRQAAENQLRLLQSQLEPHMLFNTLANLRVLIALDPGRAQAMLDRLIGFLRATLNASRLPLHPLSEEFARVDDYLALMAVRMDTRLQVQLHMPADLADVPVPPLLLQPLVENCIKHGLEPQVGGGRIDVSARRDGEQLRLCVRDTGVGLGVAGADGTRFGLRQVRERLQTLYGPAARMEVLPAPDADGGTLVNLLLPLTPPAATP